MARTVLCLGLNAVVLLMALVWETLCYASDSPWLGLALGGYLFCLCLALTLRSAVRRSRRQRAAQGPPREGRFVPGRARARRGRARRLGSGGRPARGERVSRRWARPGAPGVEPGVPSGEAAGEPCEEAPAEEVAAEEVAASDAIEGEGAAGQAPAPRRPAEEEPAVEAKPPREEEPAAGEEPSLEGQGLERPAIPPFDREGRLELERAIHQAFPGVAGSAPEGEGVPVPEPEAPEEPAAAEAPVVEAGAPRARRQEPELAGRLGGPVPLRRPVAGPAGRLLGLDVGSTSVKAVEVRRVGRGVAVVGWSEVPTPSGTLSEGGVAEPLTLARLLGELFHGGRVHRLPVVAAVGGTGVVFRTTQFPHMTPQELEEVLRWESEKHLPILREDAVVAFTILGESAPDGQMPVLLVGAQRRVVESYLGALRLAKLRAMAVDADALANFRALRLFQGCTGSGALAAVDLGGSTAKLAVYLEDAPRLVRTLPFGGCTLTEAVRRGEACDPLKAEDLKISWGLAPGSRAAQWLRPVLEELVMETRRTLDFFLNSNRGVAITAVALVGGEWRVPGLAAEFDAALRGAMVERLDGAQAWVANPARLLQPEGPLGAAGWAAGAGAADRGAGLGPQFLGALGLALRGEVSR